MINFKEKYKELFEKDNLKDRKLNKIEVLALITYRYYLVKIKQEPSWLTKNKDKVLAECIFLTHNTNKHYSNLLEGWKEQEKDLWQPEMQEDKISQYGSKNIRYHHTIKKQLIDAFVKEHDNVIPWNKIRYIF